MLLTILVICICIFVIYVIADNYHVDIKYNDVYIENLPDEFNNYTILQMTDLHSKRFENVLYDKINKINYDMIAFTGDMMNDKDYDNITFKHLIDNIKNKQLMIYVDGNNGPKTYDENKNEITDFGKQIESIGCTLLKDVYCIQKESSKIWLSNFDLATNLFYYSQTYEFKDRFKQKFSLIGNDISIGIGHKPVSKKILDVISENKIKYYKYNLIIAGHYHGGQFRIPFYGAILIPAQTPKESLFPNQKMVSGLFTYKNVNQYVSRGLGASKRIPLLNFRLFNTPQIDVIRLIKK